MISLFDAARAEAALDDLAEILRDCVDGGASVNFVQPFSLGQARGFWRRQLPALAAGDTALLVAGHDGRPAGTVMLGLDTPPNQPHRADIKKLLVHRRARRRGLARALMLAAEAEARRRGRDLLTLDTEHGSTAEQLYAGLGYTAFGIVPRYARTADGRSQAGCTFFYKDLASTAAAPLG
jgi:GNAT superfamily N-acetyltransferase